MVKSTADHHKGLIEIAEQLRACDDEGPALAGVCVPLLAKARKLAAFEGEGYAKVRTALDCWREHKKNGAYWDKVVGTVRLEGRNDPHAAHVITFQCVVSTLWPDLVDDVDDAITIGGKTRSRRTGKSDLELWLQWKHAKNRLAELVECIAASKPDATPTGRHGGCDDLKNKDVPTFNMKTGLLKIRGNAYTATRSERHVLRVLVERQSATLTELQQANGRPDKVLKGLLKKYPALKKHITLPGRAGHGGYSTTIKPARTWP